MSESGPLGRPPGPRGRRRWVRRGALALPALVALLLIVAAGGGLWLRHRVAASLPAVRGRLALAGLTAPVTVERDALGVPTLRAATRLDAARALGFVHAQERFFQMDILRRESAGEFAELLGPALLKHDRGRRLHRLRSLATRQVAALPPAHRALLAAYTDGVNAGLRALGDKPFEYILLRAEPRPWRTEDCLLAIDAMFFTLTDWRGLVETDVGVLHARLPAPLFDFLQPAGSEWDAPLLGPALSTPSIPGPEVVDLRRGRIADGRGALPPAAREAMAGGAAPEIAAQAEGEAAGLAETGLRIGSMPEPGVPAWLAGWTGGDDRSGRAGSNNWAVAGAHTADGHALLANDMHLGLGIPNIWYRASWTWRDADGSERRATGVTLPGVPVLGVGSTGRIAWGFTNSFVDVLDLVDLEVDPRDAETYRTPAGPRRFEHHAERIAVKGAPDEILDVATTIWGPVLDGDGRGHARRAVAWTADLPEGTNLGLFDLESARNVDEAIEIAHATGVPPQNFAVADATGRVGWTVIGRIPRRIGWNGAWPTSWADGTHRWDGLLAAAEVPKVVDPPSGRIWTANNRTVGGDLLARLGDGCYDLGPRARQIRDGLLGLERATPRDMLALQLDDRALFLARWRDVLLAVLSPQALRADPRRGELRRLVAATWTGHASVDSVAYRVVREFRSTLDLKVFHALTGLDPEDGPRYFQASRRFEGPLWRLVTERPAHLLDPHFKSWDELLLAAADEELRYLLTLGPRLADRTWGERNTVRVHHPLSLAVPALGRWLDVPPAQAPGDQDMPRVQGDTFGASERVVVSPGHEETGIFHMPVGESGNPLSPHYRDGHAAWRDGRPTPFLPGPPVDVLTLTPAGAASARR